MNVALFFLPPRLGNGATTFTAHLHKGLRTAGHSPRVYRVVDQPQRGARPFGRYEGVAYECVTMQDARRIAAAGPALIAALSKPPYVRDGVVQSLLALGVRPVVHHDKDAADFDWSKARRPICVRESLTALVPGSVYLPHPYRRSSTRARPQTAPPRRAVSVARVAASKRTDLLLDANRLLPEGGGVELLGVEDRLYSKALKARYPEFVRSPSAGAYHLDFDAPVDACRGVELSFDMSYFPRDGGGTQYVQLEAMDAGCVPVMHDDWFRFSGDMVKGAHALSASDAVGLAEVVRSGEAGDVPANCARLLAQHDATRVGGLYLNELMRA